MSALREALGELPDAVFADVLESDGEYLLVFDLPGVHADTVDVTATRGRLRIEARREKDLPPEFHYLEEDRALFLDADLPLPPDASAEGASASVDRGVLELRVPKRERGGETRIPIDGADGGTGDHGDGDPGHDARTTDGTGADADTDSTTTDTEPGSDVDTDTDAEDGSATS